MFELTGKTVLVAGGAGFLGTPVCEAVVRLGGRVFIADINEERLEQALTKVRAIAGADKADGARLDIGDEASITATVAGTGSVSGLAITDNIPADTSYVTSSITLGGAPLSDASDADAGDYNGTRIRVQLGTVAGGQTRTVTFKTKID